MQGEGLQNASDFLNLPVTWRKQLQMFLYDFYVSPKAGHAPPRMLFILPQGLHTVPIG